MVRNKTVQFNHIAPNLPYFYLFLTVSSHCGVLTLRGTSDPYLTHSKISIRSPNIRSMWGDVVKSTISQICSIPWVLRSYWTNRNNSFIKTSSIKRILNPFLYALSTLIFEYFFMNRFYLTLAKWVDIKNCYIFKTSLSTLTF